jgi:hypothetical protein
MVAKKQLVDRNEEGRLEAEGLRKFVFLGVTLTTFSAMCSVVVVPLVYNHVIQLQSTMQSELDFCRARGGNIWREVTRAHVSFLLFWFVISLVV